MPLKINCLRINHIHLNCHLAVKIISKPIRHHSVVHVIVEDEDTHCLHLSIYNWLYMIDTKQIQSYNYIDERLKYLLSMNSFIILLNPWLKKCHDGNIALRCESPSTNLLIIDIDKQNSINYRINIEELRQLGNDCYRINDSLSAIEFYTYGLKQLDEEQEKELASKGQSSRCVYN